MKILALETSTETASVALLDGDRLLERSVAGRPGHSETILPEIRLLLAEAGVALDALDAIAFGAGPGAFTGLRLACGVAQGLAMGLGKPVIPVGTLAALLNFAPYVGPLIGVLLMHALVEYPQQYMFFLLPAMFVIGLLDVKPLRWLPGRAAFALFAVLSVIAMILIFVLGIQPPNDWALWITVGFLVLTGIIWFGFESRRFQGPPIGDEVEKRRAVIAAAEKAVGETGH